MKACSIDLLLSLADPCLGAGEPLAQLVPLPFCAFLQTGNFLAEFDQSFLIAGQFFGVAVQTFAVLFEAIAEIGTACPALAVDAFSGAAALEVAGCAVEFALIAVQALLCALDLSGQALFRRKHAVKPWLCGRRAGRDHEGEGDGDRG